MSKAVLISMQPPHTTNVFNGTKGIEWRTKPIPTGKQFVYETKNGGGCGKVIGECSICRIRRYDSVSLIPEEHIDLGCVSYEFLVKYSNGKPLYAHFLVDAKRYETPKELGEFTHTCKYYDKSGDSNCRGCDFFYVESNESAGYYSECTCNGFVSLTRPPQSWCHVEERK